MNSSGHFRVGCWIVIAAFCAFCVICCSVASMDFSTFATVFIFIIIAILIAIIYWIIGTAKAVKEFCVYTKDAIIGLFTIKREVKQKCPQALKAVILEKKKHSINVGIFGSSNTVMTEKMTITGEGVVDDSISVGQVINLQG